jgi:hypothetical protein
MAFRNPEVLYWLFALLIPIIIHLFNFRRYTTIYFSSVERLLTIQKDTKSKSKLKNLLILLSRLLLFASLIFAFAGPFWPSADEKSVQNEKIIGICLDNSFSMQAVNEKGLLLDQAVNSIRNVIATLPPGQKLIFFTNDAVPTQSRIISRDQLVKYLGETSFSPKSVDPQKVVDQFNRQLSSLPGAYSIQREIWLFSDFQKNSFDVNEFHSDSSLTWQFFPVSPSSTANISIDSCWFDRLGHLPNEPEILKVSITNHSDNALQDIPIRLMIHDSLRAVSNVSLKPKEQTIADLNYQINQSGIIHAKIDLDDYPVTFDNSLYYSYLHNQRIRVAEIAPQSSSLWKNLFEVESFFSYQFMTANAINYTELEQSDLIIVNAIPSISSGLMAKLIDFSEKGKSIILIPNVTSSPESYNQLLANAPIPGLGDLSTTKTEVSIKSLDHPSLKKNILSQQANPRLPYFHSYFAMPIGNSTAFTKLLFNEQNQLLAYTSAFKNGKLLVFAGQLEPKFSSLPGHPIFLPLIYSFAFDAIGFQDLYRTIGMHSSILLATNSSDYASLSVSDVKGLIQFSPTFIKQSGQAQLQLSQFLDKAGNYEVKSGDSVLIASAWNYARKESNLSFYSYDELTQLINNTESNMLKVINLSDDQAQEFISSQKGTDLWRYFILLALLFLLAELVLIRRTK